MADTADKPASGTPTPNPVTPTESPSRDLVHGLLEDVRTLARYAVQTGQLPDAINMTVVYDACRAREKEEELPADQFNDLVKYYQILERHFPTISAQSLAATQPTKPGRLRTSAAGRYLVKLWLWTGGVVLAILAVNVVQYLHTATLPPPGEPFSDSYRLIDLVVEALRNLEPFLYGALGAFVYVLRVTEERLHTREFDPARAPEHVNRLVLGTLSGGAIVLFIAQVPTDNGAVIKIGTAALGFLAGYSIDFLFQTLDRVIRAILPKVGLDTVQRRVRVRRDRDRVRHYQALLDEEQDEEKKKLLREIIDDLEAG